MLSVRCTRCALDASTHKTDSSQEYEYVLDDDSTIPDYLVNRSGWCNLCGKITRIFPGTALSEVRNSIDSLRLQYKTFFGGMKKMSTYDEEKYQEYQKLLKLLVARADLSKRCIECGSHEVFVEGDRSFPKNLLKHKDCGGYISIEHANRRVNLRAPREGERYIESKLKIILLDANDNEVGYRTKTIRVVG